MLFPPREKKRKEEVSAGEQRDIERLNRGRNEAKEVESGQGEEMAEEEEGCNLVGVSPKPGSNYGPIKRPSTSNQLQDPQYIGATRGARASERPRNAHGSRG